MSHACHRFWKSYKTLTFCFAHFWTRSTISLCLPRESTSERPKVVRTPGVLTFWLRNVLRATMACTFFDIATSKSGPNIVCFVHFDFEMCFAPQQRALFRHLNFRTWCICSFFTCKCASRHNGVHFFDIATSKSGPNVRCFWLFLLTKSYKCASRHNAVHFLDISTSKSGPNVRCF